MANWYDKITDKATAGITVNVLPDDVKARFSGALDFAPAVDGHKWVYKTTSITTSGGVILDGSGSAGALDTFFPQGGSTTNELNDYDKILWCAIKHTGTISEGGATCFDGVVLNTSGHVPLIAMQAAPNYGQKNLADVDATAATPTVLDGNGAGSNGTLANGDHVVCSNFGEATELNNLAGVVESVSSANWGIDGVYVDTTPESSTGGNAELDPSWYTGMMVCPEELYVFKPWNVRVKDFYGVTAKIDNNYPTGVTGSQAAYVHVLALINDVSVTST